MKYKKTLCVAILCIFTYAGYYLGLYQANRSFISQLSSVQWWSQLENNIRQDITSNVLSHINWQELDLSGARKILTDVLDASKVPHGDMSVPSNIVHSKRYLISQWQRSAVGASVIVLGRDGAGDLAVVLGSQRGMLRNPQGYMEVALPQEDLTGLREQNASRFNSKTMEPVQVDTSLTANAVREVYEEAGIKINENDLVLLDVLSDMTSSPVCVVAHYMVKLTNTPALRVHDVEFIQDDLSNPHWIKIKDIKYDEIQHQYVAQNNGVPIDPNSIKFLKKALGTMGLSL